MVPNVTKSHLPSAALAGKMMKEGISSRVNILKVRTVVDFVLDDYP